VLTFYQERVANEGYLRTATERRSILELARLVGYELAPGVAASTFLSFVVDETARSFLFPGVLALRVFLSRGETMQSFETKRELEARCEYNELALRTTRPQFLQRPDMAAPPAALYLPGQRNDLRPPDRILLAFGEASAAEFDPAGFYYLARVRQASLLTNPARTRVDIEPGRHRDQQSRLVGHGGIPVDQAGDDLALPG